MPTSPPLLIVTGPPGSGKTSISRCLAERSDASAVHLHTDDFYAAILSGAIAPWQPESRHQNAVVSEAIAACACAFAVGGYRVIIDGIVGPWFLDVYRAAAARAGRSIDYVVLRPNKALAVERARTRAINPVNAYPPKIFEGFAELGPLEGHVIAVERQSIEDIVRLVQAGVASRRYRLM